MNMKELKYGNLQCYQSQTNLFNTSISNPVSVHILCMNRDENFLPEYIYWVHNCAINGVWITEPLSTDWTSFLYTSMSLQGFFYDWEQTDYGRVYQWKGRNIQILIVVGIYRILKIVLWLPYIRLKGVTFAV